jgi:hypothetical protein
MLLCASLVKLVVEMDISLPSLPYASTCSSSIAIRAAIDKKKNQHHWHPLTNTIESTHSENRTGITVQGPLLKRLYFGIKSPLRKG